MFPAPSTSRLQEEPVAPIITVEIQVTMERPRTGVMAIRIRVEEEEQVPMAAGKMLFLLADLRETGEKDTFSPMERHTGEVEEEDLLHNFVPEEDQV
jgi:hypothetical protein